MKEAVVAVIRKGDKVLGVSRKDNPEDFGLPGGKVDPGESRETALYREVFEETGLVITDVREVFQRTDTDFVVTAYEVTCEDLNPSSTEDGVLAWKTEEELSSHGSFSGYNRTLFEALAKKI